MYIINIKFSFHSNSVRKAVLLDPFYRCGNEAQWVQCSRLHSWQRWNWVQQESHFTFTTCMWGGPEVRGLPLCSVIPGLSWGAGASLLPTCLARNASRYTVKKLKIKNFLAPLNLNFMLTLPYIYLNNSTDAEAIVLPFLPPSFLPSVMFAECLGIGSNK